MEGKQKISQESWDNALTYSQLDELISLLHKENKVTGHVQSPDLLQYSKLNEVRMRRIRKSGVIRGDWPKPILVERFLVITEGWCGDSAQLLPYVALQADHWQIPLRILLRDDHPEVMNRFLTNGSKSIPIIVALDQNGMAISTWGPRPSALSQRIAEWKHEGLTKEEYNPMIHSWYASDKGQTSMLEWYNSLMQ